MPSFIFWSTSMASEFPSLIARMIFIELRAPLAMMPVAERARIFPSMLAAMDHCIRCQLWDVNLVAKMDKPGHDLEISLACMMESSVRPDTMAYDR